MEKIKFGPISFQDLETIATASNRYAETLHHLSMRDNHSQQHIHISILNEFRYDVVKKLTKRSTPEKVTFKLEVHAAFVLYDCLQHFSTVAENPLQAARIRRMIMELFALLPSTADNENLSVMSSLNYE